jgi:solute carrier family 25 (mitochondrial adenine nucleotide translocator), member 4/5/6/31
MSGFVTYPFDTVRRRLQMQAEKPMDQRLYTGALHCLKKIIKDEGMSALFKGAGANIVRGTGAAMVLVLYGEAQAYMKK